MSDTNIPELTLYGTKLVGGFNLEAAQPLDARTTVKYKEHLDQLRAYEGMVVYVNSEVKEDKGLYVCESITTTTDTEGKEVTTAAWRPVGGEYVTAGAVDKETLGEKTTAEGFNTMAYSDHSHAEGTGTACGVRGYYFDYFNAKNKKIYLALDQKAAASSTSRSVSSTTEDKTNTKFICGYKAGDLLTIIKSVETSYYNCKIADVNGNCITLSSMPFSSGFTSSSIGCSLYCPSKPTIGDVGIGQGAHAEGYNTFASSSYSHAEGYQTTASGICAHAEGYKTTSSDTGAHAEGYQTTASGRYSHAEGYNTSANGGYSHAGGRNTTAGYYAQTVVGKYNDNKADTLFEVGNGSDSKPSNAFEVLTDGRAKVYKSPKEDNDVVNNAVVKRTTDMAYYAAMRDMVAVFGNGNKEIVIIPETVTDDTLDDWLASINNIDKNIVKVLVFPDTITELPTLGGTSTADYTALVSVHLPSSITKIHKYAFRRCTTLSNIDIGRGITEISEGAFRECTSLKSVVIPDSVTKIGSSAFQGCTGLINAVLPDSVTMINNSVFYGCTALKTLHLGDSITNIGSSICSDSSLKSLTFGTDNSKLADGCISGSAFTSGPIEEVHYKGDLEKWLALAEYFSSFGSNPLNNNAKLFLENTEVAVLVITNDISDTIPAYAFTGCSSLTRVSIDIAPNFLSSGGDIGSYAFAYCKNLTSVTIGSDVRSIGTKAFGNCPSLTSIEVKSNLFIQKFSGTLTYDLKSIFDTSNQNLVIKVPSNMVTQYKNCYTDLAAKIVAI